MTEAISNDPERKSGMSQTFNKLCIKLQLLQF